MDPELKKGFAELQTHLIETRSKIDNIETCQKLTTHDAKVNEGILEEFAKDGNIESKFFYQPVGRMLVKQEGKVAHDFLLERKALYEERLKQYKEVKEVCLARWKESENSLRELVNKKLNKTGQLNDKEEFNQTSSTAVTSKQDSKTDEKIVSDKK